MKNQIDKEYEDMIKENQNAEKESEKEESLGIEMNGEYYQKEGFF